MAEKKGVSGLKKRKDIYVMRLFVTGASPNSARAISNLKKICEEYLKDRYELEIIDVYQQPAIAIDEQVIALPMLIKKSPGMERKLIGDMSDKLKVLKGLEINAVNL
ncbi:circadian clock KaiB family protein [Mucilaginibacter sp. BT774]|uniref:circadian clock KaiB family protein n=1 Tax=Mucilaginibacter sp. BT774 TaxID=3062276 RepID=UPI0026773E79|nr:circadian clock KaiB family protein [Mucilaginibacter sp. BT774]MDO3627962.1 circadian clock KaiB family protein [Mucilaginibacter sp. BT774]